MKHALKYLIFIITLISLGGCIGKMTPSEKTEEFLNRYIKNDPIIISELDTYLSKQGLSNDQRKKYKDIIINEYATIKYEIKEERIDGASATVKTVIDVKDLYRASKDAEDYLLENPEEFYTDDEYDKDKFNNYKLETMEKSSLRIDYTINIKLKNKDGVWTIEELDNETLEKIHGIYNYETDES